ncbi:MAG: VWA domain-containing protein [Leptolyngbyaceae bacterium]|nr:VWA domain-containing protein [Leptolyngbyaceae bacterium]
MQSPLIQLIPLTAAIPSHQATTLEVLVKVIPPQGQEAISRPRLNLSLVIDRSSSMAVKGRLDYAKAAARHVVQQLEEGDRLSVVTFDRHVQVPVKSQVLGDRATIIQSIQAIPLGKWTNLHGGWEEGGYQVQQHQGEDRINRIMLLSDGWPSVGITKSSIIATNVKKIAATGISTTTIGVGDDYNEDLLGAIATNGNGNYHYISAPEHLPEAFEQEMQSLSKLVGQQALLDIRPQGEITIDAVLNHLPVCSNGQFKLPNLVAGYSFCVVVRLAIPSLDALGEMADGREITDELLNLCDFRLTWHSPSGVPQPPQKVTLQLPVVTATDYAQYPDNPEVQQQVALLLSAQFKQEAMSAADRQDYSMAHNYLYEAKAIVRDAPPSPALDLDLVALESLEADLGARQIKQFRKRSHKSAYQTQIGYDQTIIPIE